MKQKCSSLNHNILWNGAYSFSYGIKEGYRVDLQLVFYLLMFSQLQYIGSGEGMTVNEGFKRMWKQFSGIAPEFPTKNREKL